MYRVSSIFSTNFINFFSLLGFALTYAVDILKGGLKKSKQLD